MSWCRALRVITLLSAALAVGCGDDDEDDGGGPGAAGVGSSCKDDGDCDGRCVQGGDWPGGMCTFGCNDDGDCPSGTVCVDEEGGVCAVTCDGHSDCEAAGFESSYICRSTDRKSAGGEIDVCRGD